MFDAEREMEAELEALMSVLTESDLESEAEWTAAQAWEVAEKQFIPYLISVGVTDANQIADSVFYQLHPEWNGRKLPQDTNPIHEALRQQWRDIRAAAIRQLRKQLPAGQQPAPALHPQPTFVWDTRPLPPSENGRFLRAREQLLLKVTAAMPTEARAWRYLCWLDKLKQPNVDDRVITWRSICPRIGPNPIIGPIYVDIDGWGLDPQKAEQLRTNIRSVGDVDVAGPSLEIITYLKSAIVVGAELTSQPLEGLRAIHDSVQRAINKLRAWSDIEPGGSSLMPREYVAIMGWIAGRQRDPRSLYSCM
jgi:hypothetical protein